MSTANSEDAWLPATIDSDIALGHEVASTRAQRQQAFFANRQRYRHRDVALKRSVKECVQMALQAQAGFELSEGDDKSEPQTALRQLQGAMDSLRAPTTGLPFRQTGDGADSVGAQRSRWSSGC